MLVLSRKTGENLVIGDEIVVSVLAVRSGRISLGIVAPPSVRVRREELIPFGLPDQTEPARKHRVFCGQ